MRGIPVPPNGQSPDDIERSWPNRLGVLESVGSTVVWMSELAPRPTSHSVKQVGDHTIDERELERRLRWFRALLKQLEQQPGVSAVIRPDALASIVITRSGVGNDSVPDGLTDGIAPVPDRLVEFPGGIQLRITDRVWRHRDEYADLLQSVTTKDG